MKRLTLFLIVAFSAVVPAEELPKVAVYVTGELTGNEKLVLETAILNAFEASKKFTALERFTNTVENDPLAQSGKAVDDTVICRLGQQFGARAVCVAEVSVEFGQHVVSVRMISAKTGKVLLTGKADGQLNSMEAMMGISGVLVNDLGIKTSTDINGTDPQDRNAVVPAVPDSEKPDSVVMTLSNPAPASAHNASTVVHQPSVSVINPETNQFNKSAFWTGIGLYALGIGLFVGGAIENGNVVKHIEANDFTAVEKSEKNRDILYAASIGAFLTGASIHIFFNPKFKTALRNISQKKQTKQTTHQPEYVVGARFSLYTPASYNDSSYSYNAIEELYLKRSLSPITRLHMSLMGMFDTSNKGDGVEGHDILLMGFTELHTNKSGRDNYFNFYGGPGLIIGTSSYTYNSRNESCFGFGVGAQIGVEYRFNKFEAGLNLRSAAYRRLWDDKSDYRSILTIGLSGGYQF